jgi:hypothetical protein
MANQPLMYRDYIRTLSQRFEANISYIQYVYGFDMGDEFEVAICKTLRAALPQKFGICRGHVVGRCGEQAGDDMVTALGGGDDTTVVASPSTRSSGRCLMAAKKNTRHTTPRKTPVGRRPKPVEIENPTTNVPAPAEAAEAVLGDTATVPTPPPTCPRLSPTASPCNTPVIRQRSRRPAYRGQPGPAD